MKIQVTLRMLPHWEAAWQPVVEPLPADLKTASHNPAALPTDAELRDAGAPKAATLVPYGSTYLRLTTLPIIPLVTSP